MKNLFTFFSIIFIFSLLTACSNNTTPTDDTIKIGAIYNLTGTQSLLDQPSSAGARLAVKQLNAAGGIMGKQVELIIYDGKTDTSTISAAAQKLIKTDKVCAIIGLSDTDMLLPAARIAAANQIVFLTSGATSPKLPTQVPAYLYLACMGDNVQAAAAAEFTVDSLKAKKCYLIYDKSMEYTTLLKSYFSQRYAETGGMVAIENSFNGGETDFNAQITEIKSKGNTLDCIFLASNPDDAGYIIKKIREAGINLPVIGGDSFDDSAIKQAAGSLAMDVYFTTHGFLSQENNSPDVQSFNIAYKREFGIDPQNSFAGLGFDAINILANAITSAQSTLSDKLRLALFGTSNLDGVTGSVTYGTNNYIPKKSVTILKIMGMKTMLAAELMPVSVPAP